MVNLFVRALQKNDAQCAMETDKQRQSDDAQAIRMALWIRMAVGSSEAHIDPSSDVRSDALSADCIDGRGY
jgi:hypothetical protein